MTEKEKAYLKGYEEGYEKGYSDAAADMLSKIGIMLQRRENIKQLKRDHGKNNS